MIYKVGDWVQFQVDEIDYAERAVRLDRSNHWVKEAYVELAPLPDPLAAEKAAVVATAIVQYEIFSDDCGKREHKVYYKAATEHDKAVEALIEAQRPPSKFAKLRRATDAARRGGTTTDWNAVEAEFFRLEAKEHGNAL